MGLMIRTLAARGLRVKKKYDGDAWVNGNLYSLNGLYMGDQPGTSMQPTAAPWGNRAMLGTGTGTSSTTCSHRDPPQIPIRSINEPTTIIFRHRFVSTPTWQGMMTLSPWDATQSFSIFAPTYSGYHKFILNQQNDANGNAGWDLPHKVIGQNNLTVITLPQGLAQMGSGLNYGVAQAWLNGVAYGNATLDTGGVGSLALANYFGWDGHTGDNGVNGYLGDIIMLNTALSDEEAWRASIDPSFLFEDRLSVYAIGGIDYATLSAAIAVTSRQTTSAAIQIAANSALSDAPAQSTQYVSGVRGSSSANVSGVQRSSITLSVSAGLNAALQPVQVTSATISALASAVIAQAAEQVTQSVIDVVASASTSTISVIAKQVTDAVCSLLADSALVAAGVQKTESSFVLVASAQAASITAIAEQITRAKLGLTADARAAIQVQQTTLSTQLLAASADLGMTAEQMTSAITAIVNAVFVYGNPEYIIIPGRSNTLLIPARSSYFKLH